MTAAAAEQARQDAIKAEQAAEAERAKEKDKLIRQRDHVLTQYGREEKKLAEDSLILDEAEDEQAFLVEQLEKVNAKVEVYRERINSTQDRMDYLIDEFDDLDRQITNFAVTAAEVAAQAEAERQRQDADLAEKIAAEQAQQEDELRAADEKVAAVEAERVARAQRDKEREDEIAARNNARPTQPWKDLMAPPLGCGLPTAIKIWAARSDPGELAWCLAMARERQDTTAIEILTKAA